MARKKTQQPASRPGRSRRKGKSGGYLPVLLGAISAVAIGLLIFFVYGERIKTALKAHEGGREVSIYFSSVDGLSLKPEKRRIKKGADRDEINEALLLLVNGPDDRNLGNPIPPGARIRDVAIKGRTVTVDFSPEISLNHPGGSSGEIQTVYSIVSTVAMNFSQFKDVQILIGGKKAETLAGHIDITGPLGLDPKIITE